jgi:acyl-CoA thioester hydrolase
MNEDADAPTLGRFVGRSHRLPARVYYEDTDFTGVVYHANYLRFFERGRSDFLRAAGVSHQALLAGPEPLAFAVIRADVRFLKAARIDDALVIATMFDQVQGPRLLISQSLNRGEDLIATAAIEACCIDSQGRVKRPPTSLRVVLQPYLLDQH